MSRVVMIVGIAIEDNFLLSRSPALTSTPHLLLRFPKTKLNKLYGPVLPTKPKSKKHAAMTGVVVSANPNPDDEG